MRPPLAVREIAIAGLALLAVVIAVAIVHQTRSTKSTAPQPVGSYTALAGSSGPAAFGRRTACGGVLRAETEGVAHPTLPCGARIFLTYHGIRVLTQVVDHGPVPVDRQFNLTDALARQVGLRGVHSVKWSYARAG